MKTLNISKQELITYIICAFAIVASIVIFVLFAQNQSEKMTPRGQLLTLIEESGGVDYSGSLFLDEETESIKEEINRQIKTIQESSTISAGTLEQLTYEIESVQDTDLAIQLFQLLDSMKPKDESYKLRWADVHMRRQEYEEARKVLEPMKVSWPVFEAYLGLAEAYKRIEGTPNFVIDEIYEESIYRHNAKFDVVEAYIEWLEETDRQSETLQYYQILNQIVPQPLLEERIQELKTKYPDAKEFEFDITPEEQL